MSNEAQTQQSAQGAKRPSISALLYAHIKDHESVGSYHVGDSLGFCNMPEGYALMLNPDRTHYYWLRWDGMESAICWDRWAVYRGAKTDKAKGI